MEIIQTETVTQFTYNEFQEGLSVHRVQRALVSLEHQEMNGQVEGTWRTLRTITHLIMVHKWVSNKYIHSALMYTTDNAFTVLPMKNLVNQSVEATTPRKLETGTNLHYQNYVFYSVRILY